MNFSDTTQNLVTKFAWHDGVPVHAYFVDFDK